MRWAEIEICILYGVKAFSEESGRSAYHFLDEIERVGKVFQWSDRRLKQAALFRTKGKAIEIFENLNSEYETFVDFEAALLRHYGFPTFF